MEVEKPRKSSSKTIQVKCRVEECQKTLMKQNYRDHLQDKHPSENSKDLREYGEKDIASFFALGARAKRRLNSSPRLEDDQLTGANVGTVLIVEEQIDDEMDIDDSEDEEKA